MLNIENYLIKHQKVLYQEFSNAFKNKKLAHAYLISGDVGTPLLEVAKFLGKSILCNNPSPLACDSCINCLRVDSGNYPDFMVFDGSEKQIVDGMVSAIQNKLETYSIEKKGIRIYILHLAENMTLKAVNSLLKTLEEPTSEVYAFLTTTNENQILPTIISRCQSLKLKPVARSEVINEAIDLGVKKEDAQLLSYFYGCADLILDFVNSDDYQDYLSVKELFELTLETLKNSDKNAICYHFLNRVSKEIRSRPQFNFFVNMLIDSFEEIFNIGKQEKIYLENYATILNAINSKLKAPENIIQDLLKLKTLNKVVSLPQLIDHVTITIAKEIYDK